MLTTINGTDIGNLEWYHAVWVGRCEKSTMAGIINRLDTYRVDRLPDPEIQKAWRDRKPNEPWPGEVTARPTAEVRNPGKRDNDSEADMLRAGRVSRRLAEMEPEHRRVFEAYFGDVAAKWQASEKKAVSRIGRLGALLSLVPSGRKLLERERRRNHGAKLRLTDDQRIENTVVASEGQPEQQEKSLITKALEEAQEALELAAVAWNATAQKFAEPAKKAVAVA